MKSEGSYSELKLTPGDRVTHMVPLLLDILRNRVTLLGKRSLTPLISERETDLLRGRYLEVAELLKTIEGQLDVIDTPAGPMNTEPKGS